MKRNRTVLTGYIAIHAVRPLIRILLWFFLIPNHKCYLELGKRITTLWKNNGPSYVVRYLKECVRLVQWKVADTPTSPVEEVRVAVRRGLPLIIPGPLRLLMEARDSKVIRVVLSILSFYRIIRASPVLKINTITDPFKGQSSILPGYECRVVWDNKFSPFVKGKKLGISNIVWSSSAGPNFSRASLGFVQDAIGLIMDPRVFRAFFTYAVSTGNHLVMGVLWREIQWWIRSDVFPEKIVSDIWNLGFSPLIESLNFKSKVRSQRTDNDLDLEAITSVIVSDPISRLKAQVEDSIREIILGKLAYKEEAAGKVRVFAIVDSWTQSLLSGLNTFLFDILKDIPQDGTFDQGRPLELLQGRADWSEVYSFDLSAATDRLPIDLQVQILSFLISPRAAKAWAELLVGRRWYVPEFPHKPSNTRKSEGKFISYSVGQPMGALSSWGMLALTHHFIVQLSANRVGIKGWFEDYAVLGDDVVIANPAVALVYKSLMTEVLGVDISESKSLYSRIGVFEFAKRLCSRSAGVEYTPVGPRALLWASRSIAMIPGLFLDRVRKGDAISYSSVDEIFSNPFPIAQLRKHLGPRSKVFQDLLWEIKGPFGFIRTQELASRFSITNFVYVRMNQVITSIDKLMYELSLESWQRVIRDLDAEWWIWWNHRHFQQESIWGHGCVEYSPSYRARGQDLFSVMERGLMSRPVYALKFEGPIMNFYHPERDIQVYDYVASKVRQVLPEEIFNVSIGFEEPVVNHIPRYPRGRGPNFFRKLRTRLAEWDADLRS